MRQVTWIHEDSRGLEEARAAAYGRAVSKSWTLDAESQRDFRALIVYALWASAALGPEPPTVRGEPAALHVSPQVRATGGAAEDAQRALLTGVQVLLAVKADLTGVPDRLRISTVDDGRPSVAADAAFGAAAAVAIIGVTGVVAAAIVTWLSERNELEAIRIESDAVVQRHAATLATSASLVESHVEREAAAGQSLDWTDAELSLLEDLRAQSKELAAWKAPALNSVSDAVGDAVTKVGDAVKSAGTGVGLGVAVLGGLWLLSQEE